MARPHVILVRTPLEPLSSDPYETLIAPRAELQHLPILSTSLHPQALSPILAAGPAGRYLAVIITSSRAVLAWEEAARRAVAEAPSWKATPFYVVGQATSDALHRMEGGPPSQVILGAEESGTGERLAQFIVRRRREEGKWKSKEGLPMLWLVGDKNREIIGRILREEGGIETERVQVYETTLCPSFAEDLEAALQRVRDSPGEGSRDVWITLFSPSGAKDCVIHLRRLGLLPPSSSLPPTPPTSHPPSPSRAPSAPHIATSSSQLSSSLRIRLAAIGPVTRNYLVDEEGLESYLLATAVNPDAKDVWKAIEGATGR